VTNVKVRQKDNQKGVGFEGSDDTWLAHQDDFQAVLAALNVEHGSAGDGLTEGEKKASMEAISRKSKRRVHYQKFVKGKDSSNYSADDLGCILGTKSDKVGAKAKAVEEESKEDKEEDTGNSPPSLVHPPCCGRLCTPFGRRTTVGNPGFGFQPYQFTQATGSYQDYFASKMAAMRAKGKFSEVPDWKDDSAAPQTVGLGAAGAREVDREIQRDSLLNPDYLQATKDIKEAARGVGEAAEGVQEEVEPVTKKSKKKKREKNREEENAEEEAVVEEEDKDEPEKKKKKKSKRSKEEAVEDVVEVVEEVAVKIEEEVVVEKEDEPEKRKKKPKKVKEEAVEEVLVVEVVEEIAEESEEKIKKKKTKKSKKEKTIESDVVVEDSGCEEKELKVKKSKKSKKEKNKEEPEAAAEVVEEPSIAPEPSNKRKMEEPAAEETPKKKKKSKKIKAAETEPEKNVEGDGFLAKEYPEAPGSFKGSNLLAIPGYGKEK